MYTQNEAKKKINDVKNFQKTFAKIEQMYELLLYKKLSFKIVFLPEKYIEAIEIFFSDLKISSFQFNSKLNGNYSENIIIFTY